MCIGQFEFLQFLGFFIFEHFWPFLDNFGILGASVEIWGVLGALVSYEVVHCCTPSLCYLGGETGYRVATPYRRL